MRSKNPLRHRLECGGYVVTGCVLTYLEVGKGASAEATVLALHGYGGDCRQLEALCCALDPPVAAVLPQAWRPLNAHGFALDDRRGQTWFFSFDGDRPEPATFGDSLLELEQFANELLAGQCAGRPLFLIGYDQGAVLALSLAQVIPEYIAGVVAICGYIPRIRGWSPPAPDLQRLAVLLIDDPIRPKHGAVSGHGCEKRINQLNGRVQVRAVPGVFGEQSLAAAEISTWLKLQLHSAAGRRLATREHRIES
jgi:phospholipase/carboxylesterase